MSGIAPFIIAAVAWVLLTPLAAYLLSRFVFNGSHSGGPGVLSDEQAAIWYAVIWPATLVLFGFMIVCGLLNDYILPGPKRIMMWAVRRPHR